MTAYLLDTDIAIRLIRGRPASIRHRFRAAQANGSETLLSSISLFELWYGVNHGRDVDSNTERLIDFMSGPLEVTSFGELDAARAGLIRAELAAAGTPIGPYDVLIAAQAARRGYTLVTANTREFNRVEDLACESWATAAP